MVTSRNSDLDQARQKNLYSKKAGDHLKVQVVTNDFVKVSLAAMCQWTLEGQGWEAGRPVGGCRSHSGEQSQERGWDSCVLTAGPR